MVDFRKLREERKPANPIDPVDIFRALPKPGRVRDLYTTQHDVLTEWFKRSQEGRKDIVIKLPTGGGKTLVNLLIAQSMLNERKELVLYLVPNHQLLQQVVKEAGDFSIPAVGLAPKQDLPSDALAAMPDG